MMPLDASILNGLRPIDAGSPFEGYRNALALQQGMSQNAMSQYALAKAQREDRIAAESENALRGADFSTPEGRRRALNSLAPVNPRMALEYQGKFLDQDTKEAALGKTRAETAEKLTKQAAALIAGAKTDQEMDQAFQFWARGNQEAANVARTQYLNARQSGAQVADLAPRIASMFSEDVLKQIKAFAPEVKPQDVGGTVQFVNTNTLAGPVGPMHGVNALTKTITPGEQLTDERARSEGALNRGVTMRGQNMTDARQREQNEQGKTQVVTDGAGNTMVVHKGTNVATPVTDASGKPLPQKLPESTKKELQSIDAQANTVDKAIQAAKDAPDAFGVARGLATMGGTLTEAAANKFSNDKNIQARSFVYNVVSKVINERAGAAQSVQELARLRSFLPAETDDAKVIESKLKGFKSYLAEQRKAYETSPTGKVAGASGGWKIERE